MYNWCIACTHQNQTCNPSASCESKNPSIGCSERASFALPAKASFGLRSSVLGLARIAQGASPGWCHVDRHRQTCRLTDRWRDTVTRHIDWQLQGRVAWAAVELLQTQLNSTRFYSRVVVIVVVGGWSECVGVAWRVQGLCKKRCVCKQNRKTKANDERFVGNTQKLTNSAKGRELREWKEGREKESMREVEGTTLGYILSASSVDDQKGDLKYAVICLAAGQLCWKKSN